MRIILSPAKQMKIETDSMPPWGVPVFREETGEILRWMRTLSFEEAKKLWGCSDQIAEENYARFQDMDLTRGLTPAILSYEGIAYQYMAPSVFSEEAFAYVQEKVRILSGFYGVLRPMDGVVPYRLEMQAKAKAGGCRDLYAFWGDKICREVRDESRVIINLASKEYSKCVEKYLTKEDTYITCIFGEISGGKVVQKGVYAKMARGEMIRFMAERGIEDPGEMKAFARLGYVYSEELSKADTYVFLKNASQKPAEAK